MDAALPASVRETIEAVLDRYRARGLAFHAVRTRQAGARCFVSLHVLVPGAWSVKTGHEWLERIEADIREVVPRSTVMTHLEPLEDPISLADEPLDRRDGAQPSAEALR
jgi:divalent metal cation (Fe/Co/Zn/Cd) transporter